ncbi:MAG: carbohydrate ABC transporter permease [Clostridia bacterium]|nr:carbohydrate ABC transporter permease [Clostridia bacterium]
MSEQENKVSAEIESGAPNKFVDVLCLVLSKLGFSTKYYKGSKQSGKIFMDVLDYLVLSLVGLIMLYPFWWMICASFASSTAAVTQTVIWFVNPTWANPLRNNEAFYNFSQFFVACETRFGDANFFIIVLNTLLYSIVPVVVGVITSTSAAFAFSKIEWKAREGVFFGLLAAIMIPWPSIMIVQYCMFVIFGWTENGLSMWVPGLFGSIMTAFFIRQFLYGLPTSIIEAAKIDGAGYWMIFWRFIIPLALPAMMAQGILSFFGAWNNYLGCFMMVDNTRWYNLPVVIQKLTQDVSATMGQGVVMAASLMSVIPVLILFGIFQKQIIGSLMLTGSKE